MTKTFFYCHFFLGSGTNIERFRMPIFFMMKTGPDKTYPMTHLFKDIQADSKSGHQGKGEHNFSFKRKMSKHNYLVYVTVYALESFKAKML